MALHQVLQGSRGEEILLAEPQLLTLGRAVVRIKHVRNRLGPRVRVGAAAGVIAKRSTLARLRPARGPEPERVGVTAAPSGKSDIVGCRKHRLGRIPHRRRGFRVAARVFDRAAEVNRIGRFRARKFPRISMRQPLVGKLLLPAVVEALLEQAVLVANAVAEGGDRQRRHAVEIAGGKPAEAAIAEARIGLAGPQAFEIDVERGQSVTRLLKQAEIDQRVGQGLADQEFDREVVDPLLSLLRGVPRRTHPDVDHPVAHRERGCRVPVLLGGQFGIGAERISELAHDGIAQRPHVARERRLPGIERCASFHAAHFKGVRVFNPRPFSTCPVGEPGVAQPRADREHTPMLNVGHERDLA